MTDDELNEMANDADEEAAQLFIRRRRTMEDFRYDEAQGLYWDTTTGILLSGKSVDGAIPRDDWPTRPDGRNGQLRRFQPSIAINDVDTGLTCEGSTWWPGKPRFIENVIITERGLIETRGAVCYNTYTPPDHSRLKHNQNPDLWINHVKYLFPDPVEHEHFFDFAAHMVQKPHEKVNHGIVIAGAQGIGKDASLLPLRYAVGEWNTAEIEPDAISGAFNGYVKSVMLIINEVRPHDEDHKASNFYNQIKPLLAAPPEMTPMNLKYANTIYVRNLCHVFLTTNDPLTMYVPDEDRRLFIMTSPIPDPKKVPVFSQDYFRTLFDYFQDGGTDAVVRWLKNRPIGHFQPGDPPRMTAGKQAIIDSAHQVRRTAVDDVFEHFCEKVEGNGAPIVLFTKDLIDFVQKGPYFDDKSTVLKQLAAKNFHFKMDSRGYAMIRNPESSEWRNGKFRSRMAFIKKSVPQEERAARVFEALETRPIAWEFSGKEDEF